MRSEEIGVVGMKGGRIGVGGWRWGRGEGGGVYSVEREVGVWEWERGYVMWM